MGWDGNYDTENSTMINNYLIYPEWRGMGNNNGIVMSQIDYNMKGYGVTIKNLFVDGNIPALVNLHTNSGKESKNDYVLPTDWAGHTTVGFVGNISFENVIVTGRQVTFDGNAYQQTPVASKSLIKGATLTSPAGQKYIMRNISFKDIKINSICLTDENKSSYFNIDANTTENIIFRGCTETALNDIKTTEIYSVFPNPVKNILTIAGAIETDRISLYNSMGSLIKNDVGNKMDIRELKSGLYFLKINNNHTVKILK